MTPNVTVQQGDWLDLARGLPAHSIDLLYTDPPFNTGRTHATPPNAHRRNDRGRIPTAFHDRWPDMTAYISWLRVRLEATLPAMKPTANVLVHGDQRASHHIRLMLDDLLGADRFVNHLIWHYGLGGSSPRSFARKHDDILYYCLEPSRYYFEAPRVPATSNRLRGHTKKATDVLNIPSLNNMASERTGYPTQKPLALLELLIGAMCPPGGRVLDPTCGSGTTLVAAARLGRKAVGFDVNPVAVRTAHRRLAAETSARGLH